MESLISIEQFRDELQSWKHELTSIKEEIAESEHHLEKLANAKLPKALLAEVEHFQNQFICQKEVLDRLRHDLPDSHHKLESIFNHHRSLGPDDNWESRGDILEERMNTFRKIYIELKQDFRRFEAEWM